MIQAGGVYKYVSLVMGCVVIAMMFWVYILRNHVKILEVTMYGLETKVALKESQIAELSDKIKTQNAAIEEVRNKNENGNVIVQEAKIKIQDRYVKVYTVDKTCTEVLKQYEDILRVFAEKDNK